MRKEWSIQTLDDLATVERGRFSVRPRNDPRYYGGTMPFLQTGDISGSGGMLRKWTQTLNDDGVAVSKVFPAGSIFITIAANIGDVAISTFDAACPDSVVVVQPRKDADRDWLYQVLFSKKSELDAAATQNAQKNINLEVLKSLRLEVPPLSEQRRVGQMLRTWDEAIEKTNRLSTVKAAAFDFWADDLLTGRRRLDRKRSNWQSVALTEVTVEVTARNGGGQLGAKTVMGVNKVHGMIPMKDHVRAADLSRYKIVRPGSFAYNPMRLNIGSIAQNNHERDLLVSPDYVAFEACPDSLMPAYFDHIRRTPMWSHFVKSAGSGGVRIRIYYDDLAAFVLELPPLDEQARIVELLDIGRREIAILECQRDALVKQKRGLMQKLLTGAWAVKTSETQEAAE